MRNKAAGPGGDGPTVLISKHAGASDGLTNSSRHHSSGQDAHVPFVQSTADAAAAAATAAVPYCGHTGSRTAAATHGSSSCTKVDSNPYQPPAARVDHGIYASHPVSNREDDITLSPNRDGGSIGLLSSPHSTCSSGSYNCYDSCNITPEACDSFSTLDTPEQSMSHLYNDGRPSDSDSPITLSPEPLDSRFSHAQSPNGWISRARILDQQQQREEEGGSWAAADVRTQQQQQHREAVGGGSEPNGTEASQQQQQQCAWREVVTFALPMLATLAADPLASLVDTAYVGHLGPVQLAGVGMASNIFTSITRLFNAPLLAVTTSTVAAAAAAAAAAGSDQNQGDDSTPPAAAAAADAKAADLQDHCVVDLDSDSSSGSSSGGSSTDLLIMLDSPSSKPATAAAADLEQPLLQDDLISSDHSKQQQQRSSGLSAAVSAAVWLALAFSLVEIAVLAVGCETLVSVWGAANPSPLHEPTQQFLFLRGLAAPVTVLLLVLQGVFRGLKDASTPFYATLACNVLNIALEPLFIFKPLKLGVRGSALATALAQTLPLIGLFAVLHRKYQLNIKRLLTNGLDWHSLGAMFAPTGFLLLRTISISAVFATATSLVARAGPLAAAAHQVAFQIWLASSLLADSLAVASQTLLARSTAAGEYRYARRIVLTAIVTATSLGIVLAGALGAGMHVIPGLFTQDPAVLKLARHLMPIVAFTQPLNALAFVLDGVLYGAGGFKYASAVMLLCASPSLGLMFIGQGVFNPDSADQGPPHAYAPVGGSSSSNALLLRAAHGSAAADGSSSSSSWGFSQQSGYTLIIPSQQGYNTVPMFGSWGVSLLDHRSGNLTAAGSGSSNGDLAAVGLSDLSSMLRPDESEIPAAVLWVWAGLVMLMFMRAVTILVPLLCRCYPFQILYTDLSQKRQQQQQADAETCTRNISWLGKLHSKLLLRPAVAAAAVAALEEPLLADDPEACHPAAAAGSSDVIAGTLAKQQQKQHLHAGGGESDHDEQLIVVCAGASSSSSPGSSGSSGLLGSSVDSTTLG